MGTVFEVTVVAADRAAARRLADEAIAEARRWDDVLTTWRPEGELARLNARAGDGWFDASPALRGALRSMADLSSATGGAFDPAVGPLVDLWREGPPDGSALETAPPSSIATALRFGPAGVRLEAGARLDAGGIGKGIALDAIARRLRRGGASAAYLDFGGSSQLAFGASRKGPWTVVLAGTDPHTILGTLPVKDLAVSTSRASGAGSAEGPIVDPRSRRPVDPPRLATVVAPDATTAEAWSTALIVLGPEGLGAASRNGVEAIVADATGTHRTGNFPLEP